MPRIWPRICDLSGMLEIVSEKKWDVQILSILILVYNQINVHVAVRGTLVQQQ